MRPLPSIAEAVPVRASRMKNIAARRIFYFCLERARVASARIFSDIQSMNQRGPSTKADRNGPPRRPRYL
jgi:hypothetical protein